ncbi:uncharacterized protein PHACADRAFT_259053 [Phanerochaete carnosa HHB-10118-sp]|uniref:Uncharacterized protein n=1 Tax=Phanerochaete carnosa (strain HHB-10118-sp) TaxID=650164 RepID=K5WWQ9_PHACS|nr:uncharacterized protein PHACADRAFT_259053 [Phanerochaete carnosa HHB-10118-sp]EKM54887.1 hypothetical protein PHACADRAFT_259053 [Phanerochaete carnosa HHB-10118-sp]
MTEATQRAEQHGWQNRGQGGAVVPWLEDLFSTSLEETSHPQHDTESSTTVDDLFRHAPDAFGSLIDAFERIAEAHQFRSPLLDKLCLTRRQYAASIPEQIVAQGQ